MSAPDRGLLCSLSAAYGISPEYYTFAGEHRHASDAVLTSILAAMGVDASTQESAAAALDDRQLAPWRSALPPSLVVTEGRETPFQVHLPHGARVVAEVRLEAGGTWQISQSDDFTEPRTIDGKLIGQATFLLPSNLPLGWHEIHVVISDDDEGAAPFGSSCTLAVTPDRLPEPNLATDRGWGMMAQLYSVRSRRSWGLGDFADLAELADMMGAEGADFLQINPLHAGEPVGHMSPSPYLPVTRRFVNPIYIRPEEIREVAYLSGPQRSLVAWAGEEQQASSLRNEFLDRDAVWSAKREALEVIFAAGRSWSRQAEFERFRAEQGAGLEDFALYCALMEKFEGQPIPEELKVSTSSAVGTYRNELTHRIDFWAWLQWIADEQLAEAQRTALAAGMGLGICADLAVGVHPQGSDVWSIPQAFARGVAVGAPPDFYNQHGQNWSQPPWNPDALAKMSYAPLRDMARTVLRHAGMLRIDHVAGFFRLWWIPDGMPPSEGTYVQFDHEAMIGVLLLEAHRAGATLVGEDLGNVEPWVRDYLAAKGIYGTSVLWFEKDHEGLPLRPEHYRREVLASVNTHDLPPAAGYLAGEHVDVRDRLGLLTQPVEEVLEEARTERDQMVSRLREYGLVEDQPSERQIIEALYKYIAMTSSKLLAVSLVDTVGERRTQNQPGTDQEYPNWRVPLADGAENVVLVEDLPGHVRLTSLLEAFRTVLGEDDRLR